MRGVGHRAGVNTSVTLQVQNIGNASLVKGRFLQLGSPLRDSSWVLLENSTLTVISPSRGEISFLNSAAAVMRIPNR